MRLLPGSAIGKALWQSRLRPLIIGKSVGLLAHRSQLLIVFWLTFRALRKP